MSARTYATMTEAIAAEIIAPIEATGIATRNDFNIEAIATRTLTGSTDLTGNYYWHLDATEEQFWKIVERFEKTP